MFYGFSIFTCLPAAMTERPTAATGTVIREDTMRRYASEAGFGSVERLDEPELDMLRFYLLTPYRVGPRRGSRTPGTHGPSAESTYA